MDEVYHNLALDYYKKYLYVGGIVNRIYRLEQIKLPLDSYVSLSDFKVYMNDVGLLSASANILFEDIYNENELINDFFGGLTENYVYNQLKQNKLYDLPKGRFLCGELWTCDLLEFRKMIKENKKC